MAASWRVMTASSASVSSRRARWATQRTCSADSDMRRPPRRSRHLEGFAADRTLHQAAAEALHADALGLHAAVDLALHPLQVGAEGPLAAAAHLAADAAEILGLAAAHVLVADGRLLTANVALPTHDLVPLGSAAHMPKRSF